MTEREKIALNVRFPPELHAALKAEADRLGISINALMCVVLDQWRHQRGKL